jgi:hypothetical protein
MNRPRETWRAPSSTDQIRFLERIQRLLSEGLFSATYKFALLHAIADACVERGGSVGGGPLELTVKELTDRFVGLYRRQAVPFAGRHDTRPLRQNTGRQARVVTVLKSCASAEKARYAPIPDKALAAIDETIRDQPLWKLQTLAGGERLEFLYENSDVYAIRKIHLKPGVAYCFRSFHGLIIALVRHRWEHWIRERNADLLGDAVDLREFMFGSNRSNLSAFRRVLLETQGRCCIYTGEEIRNAPVVDHFIPWSRYPTDLGHNLVLTTQATNSSKSDHLAAESHLSRWLEFIVARGADLGRAFDADSLPYSLPASLAIAEWGYGSIDRSGGTVWKRKREFEPLSGRWQTMLAEARERLDIS